MRARPFGALEPRIARPNVVDLPASSHWLAAAFRHQERERGRQRGLYNLEPKAESLAELFNERADCAQLLICALRWAYARPPACSHNEPNNSGCSKTGQAIISWQSNDADLAPSERKREREREIWANCADLELARLESCLPIPMKVGPMKLKNFQPALVEMVAAGKLDSSWAPKIIKVGWLAGLVGAAALVVLCAVRRLPNERRRTNALAASPLWRPKQ